MSDSYSFEKGYDVAHHGHHAGSRIAFLGIVAQFGSDRSGEGY